MNNNSRTQSTGNQTKSDRQAQSHSQIRDGRSYPRTVQLLQPTQNRWAVFVIKDESPVCQKVEFVCLEEYLDEQSNIATRTLQLIQQSSGHSQESFENPEDSDSFIGYITREDRPSEQELTAFASQVLPYSTSSQSNRNVSSR